MRKVVVSILVLFAATASIVFAGSSGMPQLPERSTEREAEQTEKHDNYVDMRSDAGRQTQRGGKKVLIAVGNFAAHHNGTVITCDSTVRYSDTHLECFGNVLINKGSTFIYGDRAEYNGEKNEAKIYSEIIKIVDGTTTMYTYNFTFNTQTSIGTFTGGGVVIDNDNRLESERGYYNADTKDVICVENVEMRDEKYQMKGDSVIYNLDTDNAQFFRNTNIWNSEDGEYLYADAGLFSKAEDLYRLTENGYILTNEQELWSDSLDYYRERGYALLKNNIQIDDAKNKMLVFGDHGEYWKEPGDAFLTDNPALISYDTEQGDTVFIRSDSMYLYTKDPVAERIERQRLAKIKADSIALADSLAKIAPQQPENSAEEAAEAAESVAQEPKEESREKSREQMSQRAKNSLERAAKRKNRDEEQQTQQTETTTAEPSAEEVVPESAPVADSTAVVVDSLAVDSVAVDSVVMPTDTLTAKERKALEKARIAAEKQHIRDSIKQIKADSLRVKLDRIADRRQQKRTAYYKNLERIDSLQRAKARARADKRLKRRVARLERRGIDILPVHDSLYRQADSVALAMLLGLDTTTNNMLDSLIYIYFPHLKPGVDTTAVATDTIAVDSTFRLIMAIRNVRMFRSDSQMVCDSLISRSTDSVIHLYKSPVLWNELNQISSDSMHIFSRSGRLVKAQFDGHPMIVAQLDTAHYNQIAGKEMTSYFNEKNELYRNDVNGNVQTIYYMQEQDSPQITMMAYIESGDMTSYLENRQLRGITYRTNPTYYFYPIDKIPEDRETRLKGFKWEEERRPTRDSVFTRTIRPTERAARTRLARPTFPIEQSLKLRKRRLIDNGTWSDRTDTLSIETLEWVESVKN